MNKKVLVVLIDGVEELEFAAPVDLLRRAGVEVSIASAGNTLLAIGKQNIRIQADELLVNIEDTSSFDMLLIPGGPGVLALREMGEIELLIKDFAQQEKWIAAICAAPLLLKDAGLLAGKRYTCHHSCTGELVDAELGELVAQDGKIITSRGPGSAIAFALKLVEVLCGTEESHRIAEDVMV